ncbi:acyl-CoA dehydrogenase, short-chain specific [Hyaloraphidium curvatum]|nr:acyl-CoA dehydrogenase, short-chain specific [Hyaloraphidium curvatum]
MLSRTVRPLCAAAASALPAIACAPRPAAGRPRGVRRVHSTPPAPAAAAPAAVEEKADKSSFSAVGAARHNYVTPTPADHSDIREAVRALCANFPGAYWRETDRLRAYPTEFVKALTDAGWLACLIPEEYGGSGLGIGAAAVLMEEIQRSGCNGSAAHAQLYIMGTILRSGNAEQKQKYLPKIATGELRLQAFGVTEPTAGTDTTSIRTTAVRDPATGDYVVNGQKIWTSRAEHSDLMLLLARTTPIEQRKKKTDGLSVFLVDMKKALASGQLSIRPIRTMLNHSTTEIFIENLRVPAENLIGEEGKGFRYILDGMNAERILIAAECIGDARYLLDRSVSYSKERVVFGRPIGANQGIQFPIAQCFAKTEAAALMVRDAAEMFEAGKEIGARANMAKMLAAEASWMSADVAVQTHGGFGFAEEYDIERKFRETRLYKVAPISDNLILAYIGEHVLGMPKSY